MLKKIINIIKYRYTKYIIIAIILIPLFIIGYSAYLLSKNVVKLDIPEITNKQKGTYVDIFVAKYLVENRNYYPDIMSRSNNTLTLLPGNKVLFLYLRRAIIFDFNKKIAYTNRYFSFLGYPMNSPYFIHYDTPKPVLLPDGKVYIFGEEGSEVFDSKTNKFYPIAQMQHKRGSVTATLLPNLKILIAGGDNIHYSSEAEIYDPKLNKYTSISNMNAKRYGHTATLLKNGNVLLVGGSDKNEPYAELFDCKTNKFYPIENNGKTQYCHTATLLPDDRVLIIGSVYDYRNSYSEAEIFDPKTNKFKTMKHLFYSTQEHSSVLLKSNKVFITDVNQFSDECNAQIYDLKTNKAFLVPGIKSCDASVVMLNDGKVLIIDSYYLYNKNNIKLYIP